jgi:hypothetical protein
MYKKTKAGAPKFVFFWEKLRKIKRKAVFWAVLCFFYHKKCQNREKNAFFVEKRLFFMQKP